MLIPQAAQHRFAGAFGQRFALRILLLRCNDERFVLVQRSQRLLLKVQVRSDKLGRTRLCDNAKGQLKSGTVPAWVAGAISESGFWRSMGTSRGPMM
jgi:hypothetical protein